MVDCRFAKGFKEISARAVALQVCDDMLSPGILLVRDRTISSDDLPLKSSALHGPV